MIQSIKKEIMKIENYFTRGNMKIDTNTIIFNMSPGTDCPSDKLGLCPYGKLGGNGTCYDLKAERMYKSVLPFRVTQTSLWLEHSAADFIQAITNIQDKAIKKIEYFRVNVAGDFHSAECIDKLNEIAVKIKLIGIETYTYTHRYDLIKNLHQKDLAFTLNVSDIQINDFNVFKATKDITGKKLICKGSKIHKCMDKCRLCSVNHGKTVYVKFH